MDGVVITDWGDAILTSVANALSMLLGAVPRIIGFLLILMIGWFVAGALSTLVVRVLQQVKFNQLAERSGLSDFVRGTGVDMDASTFLAQIAKWFVRLIVLVVAFDALGLPAVSQVLQDLLLWLPNLVVALVILVIAGLAAKAVAGLVRGAAAESDLGNPGVLARVASAAIWAFAIIVAVNQIGVADELVNTLFMGLVGALALALGLAFGLGGRETAAQMVASWYSKGTQAVPKMEAAAQSVERRAQDGRSAPEPAVPGR